MLSHQSFTVDLKFSNVSRTETDQKKIKLRKRRSHDPIQPAGNKDAWTSEPAYGERLATCAGAQSKNLAFEEKHCRGGAASLYPTRKTADEGARHLDVGLIQWVVLVLEIETASEHTRERDILVRRQRHRRWGGRPPAGRDWQGPQSSGIQ